MIVVAGAGFVGWRLVRQLRERGAAVTALSRSGEGETEACDINSKEKVRELAGRLGAIDTVVLAASSGRGGADAYRRVFLDGGDNLREFLRPRQFLFTSSSSVYGQTGGESVTEESAATPDRETGQILLEAEGRIRSTGGIATRLSGIYGAGRSVILKRYLQGLSVIDGDPAAHPPAAGRHLNQIHAEDAAAALAHLIGIGGEASGQVFNVTDDTPITQRALYAALDDHFGKGIPEVAHPNLGRKRGWTDKRISNEKLRATGWEPKFPSYAAALKDDPELVPSILEQVAEGESTGGKRS